MVSKSSDRSSSFFEGISFARAIKKLKKEHNLVLCRGRFEDGKLKIVGLDTLDRVKYYDLVEINANGGRN